MKFKQRLKTFEFWYFLLLGLVIILPIIAPVLSAIGLNSISKYIYFIYSFACHQFSTRSHHIADHQFAWCARDMGIWIGIFFGSILYKYGILNKIKFWWLPIFVIPIALDGGMQTIFTFMNLSSDGSLIGEVTYSSNNLTRFLTGSFFGLGLILVLIPQIISQKPLKFVKEGFIAKLSSPVRIIILTVIFLLIHIIFVQIWNISSTEYKPTNFLDSQTKIQPKENFFIRRANGECPTVGEDLFNWKCFF